MEKSKKIKPEFIRILCADPQPIQQAAYEPPLTPEPETEPEKSFWEKQWDKVQKVGEVLNKVAKAVVPVFKSLGVLLSGAAALLGAYVRYKKLPKLPTDALAGAKA